MLFKYLLLRTLLSHALFTLSQCRQQYRRNPVMPAVLPSDDSVGSAIRNLFCLLKAILFLLDIHGEIAFPALKIIPEYIY